MSRQFMLPYMFGDPKKPFAFQEEYRAIQESEHARKFPAEYITETCKRIREGWSESRWEEYEPFLEVQAVVPIGNGVRAFTSYSGVMQAEIQYHG